MVHECHEFTVMLLLCSYNALVIALFIALFTWYIKRELNNPKTLLRNLSFEFFEASRNWSTQCRDFFLLKNEFNQCAKITKSGTKSSQVNAKNLHRRLLLNSLNDFGVYCSGYIKFNGDKKKGFVKMLYSFRTAGSITTVGI